MKFITWAMSLKIGFSIKWFDGWIGCYYVAEKRTTYICLIPFCVIRIYREKQPDPKPPEAPSAFSIWKKSTDIGLPGDGVTGVYFDSQKQGVTIQDLDDARLQKFGIMSEKETTDPPPDGFTDIAIGDIWRLKPITIRNSAGYYDEGLKITQVVASGGRYLVVLMKPDGIEFPKQAKAFLRDYEFATKGI